MRIRIVQRPSPTSIDGLRLDRFQVGSQYGVGTALGMLFLAEGWAQPVVSETPAPALVVPLDGTNVFEPVVERQTIPIPLPHRAAVTES